MSNFTPTQLIINEVKNLISYSISQEEVDIEKFVRFHSAILKNYFNAKNISINYEAQTIDLQLPVSNNKYTNLTFECLNLTGFLQSCLRADEKSIYFYQNLLSRYNIEVAA